ncbi:MAG: hypothetical protein C5B51_24185 [Terriglobia bacterium]|nr:MAG: hypothetical protein C5B51_24185 [Terriglobia bacterium]
MASVTISRPIASERNSWWAIICLGERIGAAVLLGALSSALCLCAITLAVLSRRTPLIAHRRVGWRGTTLWMLKLRTMWDREAPRFRGWIERIEDEAGPQQKGSADPRVANAFAAFCRRHSIDELPQLWHVIYGEMSLVGPRPLTAAELRQYYGPDTVEVLEVRPGIAGLWQTSGRNRLTYCQRRDLDVQFVRTRSLRMYLKILLRTIPEVWSGANSW